MSSASAPRGVYCAALTPLKADLAPDLDLFLAHCRYLLDEGCDGVALLGTTGEANSFSAAERMAILEAAVEGGIAPGKLMPGTGVAALTETVALTRHALSLGVTDVVMLPPFYYKAVSDDGLFASYAEAIERIGDARLRVVLYHIPQFSAVPIPHAVIERLIARYPGAVVGIKDSSGDIANMTTMLERFPGFAVFPGADPLMRALLPIGAAGCITATSNLVARDLAFIYAHHADATKIAELDAAQARVETMRALGSRFPQMASMKALTAHRTGDAGWRRLRPPLTSLTAEQEATIAAALPFPSRLASVAA